MSLHDGDCGVGVFVERASELEFTLFVSDWSHWDKCCREIIFI